MNQDLKQTLKRGFFGNCPKCGQAKMLHKYITPHTSCTQCGQEFEPLRADDGPAWATILITGHLTMPFVFWLFDIGMKEVWLIILLSCLFITALSAIILPRAKGMFMAIIWLTSVRKAEE